MTVVLIPKEGKDLIRAKGWKPIVLMSCLLKLMDKAVQVADIVQAEGCHFYGGRGRQGSC